MKKGVKERNLYDQDGRKRDLDKLIKNKWKTTIFQKIKIKQNYIEKKNI